MMEEDAPMYHRKVPLPVNSGDPASYSNSWVLPSEVVIFRIRPQSKAAAGFLGFTMSRRLMRRAIAREWRYDSGHAERRCFVPSEGLN